MAIRKRAEVKTKNTMTTSSPSTPSVRWYYADANNQPTGPLAANALQSLYQSGTISADTLILPEGGTTWQPYHSVFPANRQFVPPPPLPPQPAMQQPVPAPAATQKCPYCAEMVSAEAKKCKHCGETLDVALRAAEEVKRSQSNQPMVFMNAGGGASSSSAASAASAGGLLGGILGFPLWLHLLLTFCTGGLWLAVWIPLLLLRGAGCFLTVGAIVFLFAILLSVISKILTHCPH